MSIENTRSDKSIDDEPPAVHVKFDGLDYCEEWEDVEFDGSWVHLIGWGHTVSVPAEKIKLVSDSSGYHE